jgi:hypothetical protein
VVSNASKDGCLLPALDNLALLVAMSALSFNRLAYKAGATD